MAGKVGRPSKKDERIRAAGQTVANESGNEVTVTLTDGSELVIQPLRSASNSQRSQGDFGGPSVSWTGAPTEGFPLVISAILGAGIGSLGQYLLFPVVDDLVIWGFESATGEILTEEEYDTAVSLSRQICWTTIVVGSGAFAWLGRRRMRGSTVWPHIFTASLIACITAGAMLIGKYGSRVLEPGYEDYYKNAVMRIKVS